jgi:hypothetical protein
MCAPSDNLGKTILGGSANRLTTFTPFAEQQYSLAFYTVPPTMHRRISSLLPGTSATMVLRVSTLPFWVTKQVKAELNIPAGGLMLFQLLMTFAFGALGLLLAVPMLGILIVLAREIYSYDLLGLRHLAVGLTTDVRGKLWLHERQIEAMPPELLSPDDEVVGLTPSESDISKSHHA